MEATTSSSGTAGAAEFLNASGQKHPKIRACMSTSGLKSISVTVGIVRRGLKKDSPKITRRFRKFVEGDLIFAPLTCYLTVSRKAVNSIYNAMYDGLDEKMVGSFTHAIYRGRY